MTNTSENKVVQAVRLSKLAKACGMEKGRSLWGGPRWVHEVYVGQYGQTAKRGNKGCNQ